MVSLKTYGSVRALDKLKVCEEVQIIEKKRKIIGTKRKIIEKKKIIYVVKQSQVYRQGLCTRYKDHDINHGSA